MHETYQLVYFFGGDTDADCMDLPEDNTTL